jgi:putative addiction module component (TIGR02574 family)
MSTVDDILAAALALPPDDRAQIADRLLESLDDGELLEEELEETVLDRLDAYHRGEVKASEWKDVEARIRARLERDKSA